MDTFVHSPRWQHENEITRTENSDNSRRRIETAASSNVRAIAGAGHDYVGSAHLSLRRLPDDDASPQTLMEASVDRHYGTFASHHLT
jgi:hypothetical protein